MSFWLLVGQVSLCIGSALIFTPESGEIRRPEIAYLIDEFLLGRELRTLPETCFMRPQGLYCVCAYGWCLMAKYGNLGRYHCLHFPIVQAVSELQNSSAGLSAEMDTIIPLISQECVRIIAPSLMI